MLTRVNRNNAVSSYERTLKDAVEKYIADYISSAGSANNIEVLPYFTAPPAPTEGLYHNDFLAIRTAIEEYEREFNQKIQDYQARRARLQRMHEAVPSNMRNRNQAPVIRFTPPETRLFNRRNSLASSQRISGPSGRSINEMEALYANGFIPSEYLSSEHRSIPIENGPELSMNKNLIGTDPISLDDFVNGETVEVMYANENKEKRNRGEEVVVKPSMVIKSSSIQGLINSGNTKNPSTRKPIRLRERRILRLINTSKRTQNNTRPNTSGASNKNKKGLRFSTKFPYFKTRKNRKSYRRKH